MFIRAWCHLLHTAALCQKKGLTRLPCSPALHETQMEAPIQTDSLQFKNFLPAMDNMFCCARLTPVWHCVSPLLMDLVDKNLVYFTPPQVRFYGKMKGSHNVYGRIMMTATPLNTHESTMATWSPTTDLETTLKNSQKTFGYVHVTSSFAAELTTVSPPFNGGSESTAYLLPSFGTNFFQILILNLKDGPAELLPCNLSLQVPVC